MNDKAGVSNGHSGHRVEAQLRWNGGRLLDEADGVIASANDEVLTVAGDHLLLENLGSQMRFRLRGTSSQGTFFNLQQTTFSVSRLSATCGPRRYILERTRPFKRERCVKVLGTGEDAPVTIARTSPQLGGDLVITRTPAGEALPMADLAFLTWGISLVDLPRQTRRI